MIRVAACAAALVLAPLLIGWVLADLHMMLDDTQRQIEEGRTAW